MILSLGLILPMIGLFPMFSRAANIAVYNPKTLDLPVMTKAMSESNSFYINYVKSDGTYNIVNRFGDGLRYGMAEKVRYIASLGFDLPAVTNQLRNDQQISASFRATLTNDWHTNVGNHFMKNWLTGPVVSVTQPMGNAVPFGIKLYENKKEMDGTYALGDNVFKDLEPDIWYGADLKRLQFDATLFGCGYNCGTAKVASPALALADRVAPRVTEVYASTSPDPNAARSNNFITVGQVIYFHVKFSEYIRFVDNSADHSDIQMALGVMAVDTNGSDGTIVADLYGLQDRYMTFRYTVPANMGTSGRTTSHFIGDYGIITDKYGKNVLDGGKDAYDLALMPGQPNVSLEGVGKVRSLVTDLAGNSADSAMPPVPASSRISFDIVRPVVSAQDVDIYSIGSGGFTLLTGAKENGVDDTLSHVGPGKYIVMTATFSKEITGYGNANNIVATLNVKRSGGDPVTIYGWIIRKLDLTNSPPTRTVVQFNYLKVESDFVMSDNQPIRITSLSTENGSAITDLHGNAMSSPAISAVVAKRIYVDTRPPVATPDAPFENATGDGFVLPIKIADADAGSAAASGVVGSGGSVPTGHFHISYNRAKSTDTYQYLVTTTNVPPDRNRMYTGGIAHAGWYSFPQILDSNGYAYLHVIFSENVAFGGDAANNLLVSVYASDSVGNNCSSVPVSVPDSLMIHISDKKGPTFSKTGESVDFAAGTVTVSAAVSDPSMVDVTQIDYYFAPAQVADPAGITSWTTCNASETDPDENAATVYLSLTKSLAAGVLNKFYLYIRAKDTKGNAAYSSEYAITADLRMPEYMLTSNGNTGDVTKNARIGIVNLRNPTASGRVARALVVMSERYDFSDCCYSIFGGSTSANLLGSGALTWSYGTLAPGDAGAGVMFNITPGAAGSLADKVGSGTHYGKLYVKVLIGYDIAVLGNAIICYDGSYIDQGPVEFFCDGNGGRKVHDATISEDVPSQAAVAGWSPAVSAKNALSTLNGKSFTVKLENVLADELGLGWNLLDLNLNASTVKVERTDGTGAVYDVNMGQIPGSTFRFEIDADAALYDRIANYRVVVALVSKAGQTDTVTYGIPATVSPITPDAGAALIRSVLSVDSQSAAPVSSLMPFADRDLFFGYHISGNPSQTGYDPPSGVQIGTYHDSVSGNINTLHFTKYDPSGKGAAAFVRVWNATLNDSGQAAAPWREIGAVDTVYEFGAGLTSGSGVAVPMFDGRQNVVAYEIAYENGDTSGVRAFTVYADDEAPSFELSSPAPEDGIPRRSATVAVRIPPADAVDATAHYINMNAAASVELPERTKEIAMNGEHWFWVEDSAGNKRIKSILLDYVDSEAPLIFSQTAQFVNGVLETTDNVGANTDIHETVDGNMFMVQFNLRDADVINGFKLILNYNDAYAKRLGLAPDTVFDITPDKFVDSYYDWVPDSPVAHGIFKVVIIYPGTPTIRIYGVHKYDDTKSEGATENITVNIRAMDRAGNSSDFTLPIAMTNVKPKIRQSGVDNGSAFLTEECFADFSKFGRAFTAYATFTVPVAEVTPFGEYPCHGFGSYRGALAFDGQAYGGIRTIQYYRCKKLGIYQDGAYEVRYTDVFGQVYAETVTLGPDAFVKRNGLVYQGNNQTNNYSLDISFSDPDPATGKVTAAISAAGVDISVWQGSWWDTFNKYEDEERAEVTKKKDRYLAYMTRSATVELEPDKDVIIGMRYGWTDGESFRPVIISPEAFRKTPPKVVVNWYYDETASDQPPAGGVTKAGVRAFLSSDRRLTAINGKETSYTFTYGGPTSYTFEYTDATGYVGSLTAALPVSITLPPPDPGDIDAPEYTMSIYGKIGTKMNQYADYSTAYSTGIASPQAAFAGLPWTRGYLLDFDIIDQSPTRLIVRAPGGSPPSFTGSANSAIPGVSASGNQIAISDGNASFEVIVIDSQNNYVTISFDNSLWKIDLAPPTAAIDLAMTSFTEVTAYVALSDNISTQDEMKLLYPPGLTRDAVGRYAIVIAKNGWMEIRFADGVGNEGTARIDVDSLDDTEPAVVSIAWSPYYVDEFGVGDFTKPPDDQFINTDVIAIIKFNTPIKEVSKDKIYDYMKDMINFKMNLDSVEVSISMSGYYELEYVARNGKRGSVGLELYPIFDNIPPNADVAVSGDAADSTVAVVTITPDETVNIGGAGRTIFHQRKPYTTRITARGEYSWTLVDLAGNVSTVTAKIENIDEEPPVVTLSGLPDPETFVSGTINFTASMNEAGTITFDGRNYAIPAGGGAASLSVARKGNFAVTGKDLAGRTAIAYFSINNIDDTPPKLYFKTTTISVIQNSAQSVVDALLNDSDGWIASDDITPANKVAVRVKNFDPAWLNVPGTYTLLYEAKDEAGNAAEFTRLLKVRSLKDVVVKLGGVMTYSEEMAILGSTNITMEIRLPDGANEPYNVYLRAGRWTAAQLKTTAQQIKTTAFTANRNTVYTLCIVTQSRGTYLTYFYVE